MAIIRQSSEADFTFEVQGYGEELRVTGFNGTEEISQLFRFDLELAAEDSNIPFSSIVNKPATLTIHGENGERYVNGIVSRFEQTGEREESGVTNRFTSYSAELVPTIWLLSHRHKSRIFQETKVPDIIKKVLTDAGIPGDQFKFSLQGQYQPLEYCVQYRETELDFIARLMEQEGIFYFFEHSEDKHVLIMGDSPAVHQKILSPDTVIFHEPSGGVPTEEYIFDYRYSEEVRPGKLVLKDFNFKKPKLNLEAKESDSQGEESKLEVYDFPGEYKDPGIGKTLAKIRLEELRAIRQIGSGSSVCRRFIPGFRFTLDKHIRTDFNKEYLITEIMHTGSQPQSMDEQAGGGGFSYENNFECIPFDVPYRPSRITPKPLVQGTQTAVVVGPAGEEIHTDEHGRVRVQFHWDRNDRVLGGQDNQDVDKCSCWMRVSQVWAGASWGAMYIPRIGHEVIVDFLEGDPDQPIIIGRVYHGDNKPPYPLPADKTKSTIKSDSSKGGGGSNEFRYEDKKGKEEIYLHGQKDWTIVIENDKNQTIGHDETLRVKRHRNKSIGKNQSETIGENKSISVEKNHDENIGSDMTLNVGKNFAEGIGENHSEKIGKDNTVEIAKNSSINIGENHEVEIGKNMNLNVVKKATITIGNNLAVVVEKGTKIDSGDQITLKCGKAILTLKKNGDIKLEGGKIQLKASGDITMKGSTIKQN